MFFSKSPGLCILRREMSALVSVRNVYNSESDMGRSGEALYCSFSTYRDSGDLDLYFV